jgi:hypothetical protein
VIVTYIFERRRWAFGQYKVEGTIIDLGLCVVASCGLAIGWLGTWGLLVWTPRVLGFLFVALVGHFLLLLPPFLAIQGLLKLWSEAE